MANEERLSTAVQYPCRLVFAPYSHFKYLCIKYLPNNEVSVSQRLTVISYIANVTACFFMMKNLCKTTTNVITGVYLFVPPLMEKEI